MRQRERDGLGGDGSDGVVEPFRNNTMGHTKRMSLPSVCVCLCVRVRACVYANN